jgi:serine/threonine-protein kinase
MERGDLLAIPIEGQAPRSAVPLVATSSGEGNGTISPDGRWLAYQSNESGAWEVYVRPFPVTDNGLRTTVSSGGGTQHRWSSDGRELYYFSARTEMMAVRVPSGPTWSAARAEKLFDASQYFIGGTPNPFFNYDVAKNGRFLMLKPVAGSATDKPAPSANMVVVQNWLEEVKRLVPRD